MVMGLTTKGTEMTTKLIGLTFTLLIGTLIASNIIDLFGSIQATLQAAVNG